MKKLILKNFKWLVVSGFLAGAYPRTSLYAPDIPLSRKGAYELVSSTFSAYDIAFSTSVGFAYSFPFKSAQKVKPVETFVLLETPRKILVPESAIPGNAVFALLFDNPAADIVIQAKIYDLTGAEVADFTDTTGSGSNPARLTWDGRDKNGSIVRSGVYIYQVQAGNSLVNGTVVVAR